MFTLSAAEMYIRNAYEHGFWSISAAVLGGVALYYFLQPFLPDFADHTHGKKASEVSSQLHVQLGQAPTCGMHLSRHLPMQTHGLICKL